MANALGTIYKRGGLLGSINGPWVDDPEWARGADAPASLRPLLPEVGASRPGQIPRLGPIAPIAEPSFSPETGRSPNPLGTKIDLGGPKSPDFGAPELPQVFSPIVQARKGLDSSIQRDQQRLSYLNRSGSGIDQITHPVDDQGNQTGAHVGLGKKLLGGLARAGDIALSALTPGVAAMTPGTTLHHDLLRAKAEGNLSDDLEHDFKLAQTANVEAMPEYRQSQMELQQERQRSTAQHQRDQEENNLRTHGYKYGENGQIVPISYDEMSPQQQAVYDLKGSQDEYAQAQKAYKEAQMKDLPEQMELARRRAETAERNAQTAAERLGLSREALEFHQDEFYNPQPTGAQRVKADLAQSALDRIATMRDIVRRRPDLFGPGAGRSTKLKQWLGSSDPDAVAYNSSGRYLGDHSTALFGGRGLGIMRSIESLTDPKFNAAALNSALDEAERTARGFASAGQIHGRGERSSFKGGGKQEGQKGSVSLKDAMSLPENRGKSEDEVRRDIRAHGYEVR